MSPGLPFSSAKHLQTAPCFNTTLHGRLSPWFGHIMHWLLQCDPGRHPNRLIRLLQLIQNSAARIITRSKSTQHVTPPLIQLHWLPVSQRINFKIALLKLKAFIIYPLFTSHLLQTYLDGCQPSPSAQWVPGPSPKRHPNFGTAFLLTFTYCTLTASTASYFHYIFTIHIDF